MKKLTPSVLKKFLVTYIVVRPGFDKQSFYTRTVTIKTEINETDALAIYRSLKDNSNYVSMYEELVLLNFWEIEGI